MKELLVPYKINAGKIEKLEGYISSNYKITDDNGEKFVLKHYKDRLEYGLIQAESDIINTAAGKLSYNIPENITVEGKSLYQNDDQSFSRLTPFIEGVFFAEANRTDKLLYNLGKAAAELDLALKGIRSSAIESRKLLWDIQHSLLSREKVKFILSPGQRKLVNYFLDQFEHVALPEFPALPQSIIHNDFNDWNILTDNEEITGLLDFGDIAYTPVINELAIAITYAIFKKDNPIAAAKQIIRGYQSVFPRTEKEIELLYYLIAARLCISVCSSAEAKAKTKDSEYILISESDAWDLLEKWVSYSPVYIKNEFLTAAGFKSLNFSDLKEKAKEQRKKYFSPSLSLSYTDPIYMKSSAFQYMFDGEGNSYLDAYNNIPLVGHCHPNITRAISKQIRELNTNTRYYYDALGNYAEKLLGYFLEKLNKIFFVNSGSAASDLAVRLAKNFTGRKHLLVLEHGYHGNTQIGIEISAYKFDGKGGSGSPQNTIKLPLPKTYNSIFSSGTEYANDAIEKIEKLIAEDIHPAAFIAETVSGCGGQVPLADDYLKVLYPFLKKNNILTIADEVQTGFGRLGTHFWAYEMQHIIPDMVILGKPMGNGHPIGAVVTTTEIADAFANGMEFFSSFGGNPVSCEAAKAVLETVEEEQLMQHAKEVGDYYIAEMTLLQKRYACIGDIRGSGLFLGIEFIKENNEADTALASYVTNQLKEQFVLTSTDGPYNNVLKTKPPLCFSKKNVDEVIGKLDTILRKYK